ncbi:MAG: iron-sulfur cluster carrier protein ApbC [Gammaproteobacteria bacterium]|nr:iron-sulfur cluster carrier protein ApbC [Gammaproteobacteria bacterium]
MSDPTALFEKLQDYIEPYTGQRLVSTQKVDIKHENHVLTVHIQLGFPALSYKQTLEADIRAYLGSSLPSSAVFNITSVIQPHIVQGGLKPLPQVKNIIAVASGKGGVGKSTTAVNLALALQAEGAKVGILDADIYGPNQPQMLGICQKPESKDGKHMEPIVSHGLQSMSIGYLVEQQTPMVWRGPMVSGALQQLLQDTAWHDLDYLIVDLPPGTGDVQLTLAQKIPVSGAVIVTTPQDIALLDVHKAIGMFRKVNVPILGVIENMSLHICSQCGHQEPIFGTGGGELVAAQYEVPLLGQLPLDIRIREQADRGNPTVAENPDSALSILYRTIASKLSARLSVRTKNMPSKFPKIVVSD